MSNLTIKQKIILGVIVGIMVIVIGIYGYISLNADDGVEILDDVNNEQNVQNEVQNNVVQNENTNNLENKVR